MALRVALPDDALVVRSTAASTATDVLALSFPAFSSFGLLSDAFRVRVPAVGATTDTVMSTAAPAPRLAIVHCALPAPLVHTAPLLPDTSSRVRPFVIGIVTTVSATVVVPTLVAVNTTSTGESARPCGGFTTLSARSADARPVMQAACAMLGWICWMLQLENWELLLTRGAIRKSSGRRGAWRAILAIVRRAEVVTELMRRHQRISCRAEGRLGQADAEAIAAQRVEKRDSGGRAVKIAAGEQVREAKGTLRGGRVAEGNHFIEQVAGVRGGREGIRVAGQHFNRTKVHLHAQLIGENAVHDIHACYKISIGCQALAIRELGVGHDANVDLLSGACRLEYLGLAFLHKLGNQFGTRVFVVMHVAAEGSRGKHQVFHSKHDGRRIFVTPLDGDQLLTIENQALR